MSGSTVTSPPVAQPRLRRWPTTPGVGALAHQARAAILRRPLPWSLGGCALLAALTLLAPAAPTYDPWSWVIWGREVLHLDLDTAFGPSWKPLPVMFTTVFALFGGAAPALWLLTARAGALAGALFAFRLGRRLGGDAAGIAAAVALLVAPWYVRSAALASSEGLQVAFALAAIDRALAGRRMTAFTLSIGLGLLRPEAWPFIAAFGAWIVWCERRRALAVAAGLVSLPVLWLVPEKLGSGDWLRAAHRAQQPIGHSAAFSNNPVVQVLNEGWLMLDRPVHWALFAAVAVAVVRRDRRFAALAGLVGAWAVVVAVMTAHGYSGNQRYLVVPAALAIVVAAAGVAQAVGGLVALASRRVRGLSRRGAAATVIAVAGGLALGWWLVAPWIEPARQMVAATSWQARLAGQLAPLVARAGGPARVRACGVPVTGAYLVPAVAWHLGVHISDVQLVATRPGVVFRVHTTRGAPPLPTLGPFAGSHGLKTLATTRDWRIVAACPAGS
jgi:hypothetical protein